MKRRDTGHWMWAEAVHLLEEADRLQRQCFQLAAQAGQPRWEPPVDIYEGDGELLIEMALPGVPPERLQVELDGEQLIVQAERRLPHRRHGATIRRLEIPYGLFERRLALPPGSWAMTVQDFAHGCLRLLLTRR
jgi:HSP20 family protein